MAQGEGPEFKLQYRKKKKKEKQNSIKANIAKINCQEIQIAK
jgi:hypothetical protein